MAPAVRLPGSITIQPQRAVFVARVRHRLPVRGRGSVRVQAEGLPPVVPPTKKWIVSVVGGHAVAVHKLIL